MATRSGVAQNSANVFNRGKKLRFPIGIQPVKQISADQKASSKSFETRILNSLNSLRGASSTFRDVALNNIAKNTQGTQTEGVDTTTGEPVIQNQANAGNQTTAEPRAVPHEGVDVGVEDNQDDDISQLSNPQSKADSDELTIFSSFNDIESDVESFDLEQRKNPSKVGGLGVNFIPLSRDKANSQANGGGVHEGGNVPNHEDPNMHAAEHHRTMAEEFAKEQFGNTEFANPNKATEHFVNPTLNGNMLGEKGPFSRGFKQVSPEPSRPATPVLAETENRRMGVEDARSQYIRAQERNEAMREDHDRRNAEVEANRERNRRRARPGPFTLF